MSQFDDGMALLGLKVKDRVTGLSGVVTSVSFDLYGCVQVIVHPGVQKDETKLSDMVWFDAQRLEVISKNPVMPVPDFGRVKGPELKPVKG